MKDMGELISSFFGGATLVIITMTFDKAIEVVLMALIGGVIGAFAKGAGHSLWEFTKVKLKKKPKQ